MNIFCGIGGVIGVELLHNLPLRHDRVFEIMAEDAVLPRFICSLLLDRFFAMTKQHRDSGQKGNDDSQHQEAYQQEPFTGLFLLYLLLLLRQLPFFSEGIVLHLRNGQLSLRLFVLQLLVQHACPLEPSQCFCIFAGCFGAGIEVIASFVLLFAETELLRKSRCFFVLLELQETEHFGHLIVRLACDEEGFGVTLSRLSGLTQRRIDMS